MPPVRRLPDVKTRKLRDLGKRRQQVIGMLTMEKNRLQIMPRFLQADIRSSINALKRLQVKLDQQILKLSEQVEAWRQRKNAWQKTYPWWQGTGTNGAVYDHLVCHPAQPDDQGFLSAVMEKR